MEVSKQIKLLDVLKKCFPTKWEQMLAIALYILDQSGTMMYIDDWFEENKIDFLDSMTDVKCSKLFASITPEEMQLFFQEWTKLHTEKEYLVYDTTSISTYSKNIESAEWGYNRDNDQLPQVNFGMFYGVTSRIPVYYNMYSGSIPDKACLEFMMLNAKDIGLEQICFVFDQGLVTKENLACVFENQFSFITALPQSRIDAKELINGIHGSIEKMEHWINDYRVYGVQRPISLHGHTVYAHVYYSHERKMMQTNEHYAYLEKLQQELEKMSKSNKVPNRYKSYFIIEEQAKNAFTFKVDYEKTNEMLSRMGYFVLLTSNSDLSSLEVLKTYREKDVIEKHFNQLKNGLEFKRLKTHCQKTSEGKLFVGFLALILRSYMLHTIKANNQTKQLTFEKVMIELRKIKSVIFTNMKEVLSPLTSLQKNIMEVLGINGDILMT